MKTTGGTTSGTTFIDLEDVRVPTENLIGKVSLHNLASSHILASSPIFYPASRIGT
jgi:alkylation response protein AidB-like acyl-CoA dehydrogenase